MSNRATYEERQQPVDEKQERARKARRDWYYRNKQYVQSKVIARKQELTRWFEEYKATLKCAHCGQDHPAALDFHHRDGQAKDTEVGKAVSEGWCKERIVKEIAKCDVLCASCHRILHWKERQNP